MYLIATATEKELDALGIAGTDSVRTVVTGVGVINAALTMGRELERKRPTAVLSFGLAGSFDLRALPFGSICVVQQEIWPEYGLGRNDAHASVDAKGLKFPVAMLDGDEIWDRLDLQPDKATEKTGIHLPAEWPRVNSLTVSTVSATPNRADALHQRYGAGLENMEGFALALACAKAGVPFIEIRTVSNLVGSRDPKDWDFQQGFAALSTAASTALAPLLPLDGGTNDR